MKHLTWVAIALFVAACSNGTEAPPAASPTAGGPTLTVEGRAFGQAPQLAAGESMTIDNRDSVRHTFTSADDTWEEVSLAADSSSVFTVPDDLAAGAYRFVCVIHPDMGGSLTVTG